MRKSIVFPMDRCCICGTNINLHSHEIFFGSANRKKSIKYKMVAPLCLEHHEGNKSPHHDKEIDLWLKQKGQEAFEKYEGDRGKFIKTFGKSYLDCEIKFIGYQNYDITNDKLPF